MGMANKSYESQGQRIIMAAMLDFNGIGYNQYFTEEFVFLPCFFFLMFLYKWNLTLNSRKFEFNPINE